MEWVVGIGIYAFLLFQYPKKTVILTSIMVFIVTLIVGYIYLDDYLRKKRGAAIRIAVSFDLWKCSSEYPLLITIKNDSGSIMNSVKFSLEGIRSGYSDPIYESSFQQYRTDKIIRSGESYENCWKVPQLSYERPGGDKERFPPQNLNWQASWISPRFSD